MALRVGASGAGAREREAKSKERVPVEPSTDARRRDRATGDRQRAPAIGESLFDQVLRDLHAVDKLLWGDQAKEFSRTERPSTSTSATLGVAEASPRTPWSKVRCQDIAKPGEWVLLIGNDLEHSIGVSLDVRAATIATASALMARYAAPVLGPMSAMMTAEEAFVFDQLLVGPYTDAVGGKLLDAYPGNPAPGRCFVHQPDRPDLWWAQPLP